MDPRLTIAIYVALLLLGTGCQSAGSPAGNTKSSPESPRSAVSLRRLPGADVNYDDGVAESEAALLKDVYFPKLVGSCGIPNGPIDDGPFWRVDLWGGYAGSDYGMLRIAKDGSKILLTPPKRGFKSITRRALADLKLP